MEPRAAARRGPDTSRRLFLKEAAVGLGVAAGIAGAILGGEQVLRSLGPRKPLGITGPYYGTIEALEIDVVVLYLEEGDVDPEMRGVVATGFAAYNAKCTHLGCTCLWRTEEEAGSLLPLPVAEHDVIIDPCHMCTFDPYDAGKVLFGPPNRPLEQLAMGIKDGLVQIEFSGYSFGGETPQV